MDRESPDVIAQEMEETRSSLTGKVAALETHVVDTLQNATEAVSTTEALLTGRPVQRTGP